MASPPMSRLEGSLAPRILLGIAICVLPALLTIFLVFAQLHASLDDFVPSYWNDQVAYWHRIASFAAVGFDFGSYNPDEMLSPIANVRFGVNGPWFPLIYGPLAAITGWAPSTSIYFNMAAIAVSTGLFMYLAGLDRRQMLYTGLAVCTAGAVLIYMPTAGQESLNQAIAIVLAAVFFRAIQRGHELGAAERYGALAFLLGASVVRFSWVFLLPVLFLLYTDRPGKGRFAGSIAVGAIVAIALMKLTSLLQPPGLNSAVDGLAGLLSNPLGTGGALLSSTWTNLGAFLYPGALDPTSLGITPRGALEHTGAQSWEFLGLLILSLAATVATWRGWERVQRALGEPPLRESLFHLVNLGTILGASLVLYIPGGFYRLLAAHLLLSLLVLVAHRRFAPIVVIAVINVIMLPAFLGAYGTWAQNFDARAAAVVKGDRLDLADTIRHQPDAPSPWCNTLLLPVEAYDRRVMSIPPGIGVAVGITPAAAAQPKSRYILIPRIETVLGPAIDTKPLKRLGQFAAGTLYENPQSLCFGPAS